MVSAPMLSFGFSFMLFVWPLMTKHLDFIQHHLTEKEFHARLDTMMKLNVDDELIKRMTRGQKCKNIYQFFFCRKVPKSEILL